MLSKNQLPGPECGRAVLFRSSGRVVLLIASAFSRNTLSLSFSTPAQGFFSSRMRHPNGTPVLGQKPIAANLGKIA
jgi:hypothetical protein